MGDQRLDPHRTDGISHLVHVSRRKSGVWRDNQQFFTHEAAIGTVAQIIENWLIWFGNRSFKREGFQRPDWICGSFYTVFKLARLVEEAHINVGRKFFLVHTNRPRIRC